MRLFLFVKAWRSGIFPKWCVGSIVPVKENFKFFEPPSEKPFDAFFPSVMVLRKFADEPVPIYGIKASFAAISGRNIVCAAISCGTGMRSNVIPIPAFTKDRYFVAVVK